MFQIVRYWPVYCPSRDGLIGCNAKALPMTYSSKRLAQKLAGRMEQADFDGCGDDSFGVIEAGASAFPRQTSPVFYPAPADPDNLPF